MIILGGFPRFWSLGFIFQALSFIIIPTVFGRNTYVSHYITIEKWSEIYLLVGSWSYFRWESKEISLVMICILILTKRGWSCLIQEGLKQVEFVILFYVKGSLTFLVVIFVFHFCAILKFSLFPIPSKLVCFHYEDCGCKLGFVS